MPEYASSGRIEISEKESIEGGPLLAIAAEKGLPVGGAVRPQFASPGTAMKPVVVPTLLPGYRYTSTYIPHINRTVITWEKTDDRN